MARNPAVLLDCGVMARRSHICSKCPKGPGIVFTADGARCAACFTSSFHAAFLAALHPHLPFSANPPPTLLAKLTPAPDPPLTAPQSAIQYASLALFVDTDPGSAALLRSVAALIAASSWRRRLAVVAIHVWHQPHRTVTEPAGEEHCQDAALFGERRAKAIKCNVVREIPGAEFVSVSLDEDAGIGDAEDRERVLRRERQIVAAEIAKNRECKILLVGEDATSLAVRGLLEVVMGGGTNAAKDIGYKEDICGVKFLRVFRELTSRQVARFNRIAKVEGIFQVQGSSGLTDLKETPMEDSARTFVAKLQDNKSSTVSTILRTLDKTNTSSTTALLECDICQRPTNPLEGPDSPAPDAFLCYACQQAVSRRRTCQVPIEEYTAGKDARRQAMKDRIQDCLL